MISKHWGSRTRAAFIVSGLALLVHGGFAGGCCCCHCDGGAGSGSGDPPSPSDPPDPPGGGAVPVNITGSYKPAGGSGYGLIDYEVEFDKATTTSDSIRVFYDTSVLTGLLTYANLEKWDVVFHELPPKGLVCVNDSSSPYTLSFSVKINEFAAGTPTGKYRVSAFVCTSGEDVRDEKCVAVP